MTPRNRLARLAGLVVLWGAVELLERIAYSAGVDAAGGAFDAELAELAERFADVDEHQDDDELEGVDLSDVLAAHAECCGGWAPASCDGGKA